MIKKTISLNSLAFSMIQVPDRECKPRTNGVTMVLDKSLGPQGLVDLVELGGRYIDVHKFGWGTTRLIEERLLRTKLEILREHQILACPGGTFLEIALAQECENEFLRYAIDVGFSAIEVSRGVHPSMSSNDKRRLIHLATDMGFVVFAEVGRKAREEDRQMSVQQRVDEANFDLESGARKVIIEARESGTVGVFDGNGQANAETVAALIRQIDPERLIWEAPLKSQQIWLVKQLGIDVNLGNIACDEVIAVETLRRGLRADTFGGLIRKRHV